MDYRKRIIKHLTKLQRYIRQAATTNNFPTAKHLARIQTELVNAKKLIRAVPVYHSRSTLSYHVSLDALFRVRIGQSIFVSGHPNTIIMWCKANGLKVEVTTLNVTSLQDRRVPKKLIMIKLLERSVDHERELSEYERNLEGDEAEHQEDVSATSVG